MAKNAEVEASYSGRIRATKIFRTIICVILCIISVFPFYLMIVNSTLDSNTIKTGVHLLPGSFAQFGKNFSGLMAKAQGVGTSLWGAMLHSAIISVPATILTVYCSTLTAYGLTVYNFKLKNAAHTFIMAIMMIPAQVSIIGFMQFMMKVHLYDSYWPLILPAAASPATYYFMKQYMATGLSLEIIEAARIDGCSEARIFFQMVLPMSRPIVVYTVISSFLVPWMDFVYAKMILNAGISSKYTVAIGLYKMLDKSLINSYFTQFCAGGVLVSIPISILFMIMQKFYVEGITGGAVKG